MKLIVLAIVAIVLTASCGKEAPPPAPAPSGSVIPSSPGAIGQLHSLQGDVKITTGGSERRAEVGTALAQGDIVKVGTDAWALLAMVDGATLTLRPETELKLDQYRYDADGDPQQNSSKVSLSRGSFRAITGNIGKSNPPGYQVATQDVVLGIRGTDHEPAYYPPPPPGQKSDRDPGTYDKVNEGETFLRGAGGEVAVRRGQTAFAGDKMREPPKVLSKPPQFYERHAEIDRRAVERRADFQKRYAEESERKQAERRQRQDKDARKDDEKKGQRDTDKKDKKDKADRKDGGKRDDATKAQQDAPKADAPRDDATKGDADARGKRKDKKRDATADANAQPPADEQSAQKHDKHKKGKRDKDRGSSSTP